MRSMIPDKSILVRKLRIPTANGGIPALVLSPQDAPANATGALWLHGGGYAVGMKEMVHMSRAVGLVKKFGAVVLSPGYRLSPQAPYPAAADDCWAALLFLRENAAARNRVGSLRCAGAWIGCRSVCDPCLHYRETVF